MTNSDRTLQNNTELIPIIPQNNVTTTDKNTISFNIIDQCIKDVKEDMFFDSLFKNDLSLYKNPTKEVIGAYIFLQQHKYKEQQRELEKIIKQYYRVQAINRYLKQLDSTVSLFQKCFEKIKSFL